MPETLCQIAVQIQHRTGTPADQITPETLLEDLFACGLDMTGLQCAIDETFEIYLPGETWRTWRTVADIITTVEQTHA